MRAIGAKSHGGKAMEERRYRVLGKLIRCGLPLSFADIGEACGPDTIKNMAARGLIKVQITITAKGMGEFEDIAFQRQKRAKRAERKARMAALEAA